MSFQVLNWENSVTGVVFKNQIYTFFWDADRTLNYVVGAHQSGPTSGYKVQITVNSQPIYAEPFNGPPARRQPLAAAIWEHSGKAPYIVLFYVDRDRSIHQLLFNDTAKTWRTGVINPMDFGVGPYTSLWVSGGPYHKVVYTDPNGVLTELWWNSSLNTWKSAELS